MTMCFVTDLNIRILGKMWARVEAATKVLLAFFVLICQRPKHYTSAAREPKLWDFNPATSVWNWCERPTCRNSDFSLQASLRGTDKSVWKLIKVFRQSESYRFLTVCPWPAPRLFLWHYGSLMPSNHEGTLKHWKEKKLTHRLTMRDKNENHLRGR